MGTGTNQRSDIYSLGATLYFLLTGVHPPALNAQLAGKKLESPSKFLPDLPAVLDKAILRALENDPERRPQSVEELTRTFDDLERTLPRGLTGSIGPSQLFRRKNLLLLVAMLMAVAGLLGGAILLWRLLPSSGTEPPPPTAKPVRPEPSEAKPPAATATPQSSPPSNAAPPPTEQASEPPAVAPPQPAGPAPTTAPSPVPATAPPEVNAYQRVHRLPQPHRSRHLPLRRRSQPNRKSRRNRKPNRPKTPRRRRSSCPIAKQRLFPNPAKPNSPSLCRRLSPNRPAPSRFRKNPNHPPKSPRRLRRSPIGASP